MAIQDFGEKLGGAKKDRAQQYREAIAKEFSDEELATLPLSKIWPKESIGAIEDTFVAAVAFAARAEIPSKPRTAYALNKWVRNVKTIRSLAGFIMNDEIGREAFKARVENNPSFRHFLTKVELLESLDRSQWGRIGAVEKLSYRDNPCLRVQIDGKTELFNGKALVSEALDDIREKLGTDNLAEKKMEFDLRGNRARTEFFFCKKGDPLYRKLKIFDNPKEAFQFLKDHHDELVAAWENVKEQDNVKEVDLRVKENRPRSARDWRNGKDITPEEFDATFGFRGVEFGNYVGQGTNIKERQGMLNHAYDAFMDLADIVGIPPRGVSLNGQLGIGFGSRGSGGFSAHYEPSTQVINLTKTRGAGTLAHEWFHALDNFFARMRGGEVKIDAKNLNPQEVYRQKNYITYRPEALMVRKDKMAYTGSVLRSDLHRYFSERGKNKPGSLYDPTLWEPDPFHPAGVPAPMEQAFTHLVETLNASPMNQRALGCNRGTGDYWSRIIERSARAFENYVIHKLDEQGYHNDYLANVVSIDAFPRNPDYYPYLLKEEIPPVAEAFDRMCRAIAPAFEGIKQQPKSVRKPGNGLSM